MAAVAIQEENEQNTRGMEGVEMLELWIEVLRWIFVGEILWVIRMVVWRRDGKM
jgi:hypothetical protein